MSGGVDSSVAVALLKRAGPAPEQAWYGVNFDVIGVFMKFWSGHKRGELAGFNRCCSQESEIRARKVAKILKIPFYVFNFEKEFKKRVVDNFLKEYKVGLTPNPCVVCNKEIKFGLLLEKALALGADFMATGHYARKKENLTFSAGAEKVKYWLFRGKDKNKDQSYFLWRLNQKQLKHILFPVGNYTKTQVRKLAKKLRLPVTQTPESQEICFIPDSIEKFLKKHIKEKPGKIVNKEGEILGKHQGLWFYTIGQRKGIGLAGGPYFVLSKDLKRNHLIVTKNEKDLLKKELLVKNVNWIGAPSDCSVLDRAQKICALVSGKELKFPLKIKAKIRYRHEVVPAKIYKIQDTKYKVVFNQSQRAVTPGQSVVFYKGQELLGGGIIC